LSANWNVVSGDFARNASGYLSPVSTSNLAVLNGVSATNVSASVTLTNLLAGQSAALVVRYQGTGDANYYDGFISRTGNTYSASIYKNVNGTATLLTSMPIPAVLFNGTGTIQFEAEGPSLRLFVVKAGTPTPVAAVADYAITTPGSVGIRGSAGAQFSNYAVNAVTLTAPVIAPPFTDPLVATSDGQLGPNWLDVSSDFASNAAGYQAPVEKSPANVAVLNGVAAINVSESVSVTNLLSGQSAALVARYQGPGDANYYLATINRTGNVFTAMIDKNIKGVYTLLVSTPVPASLFNGTGTIQFEAEGPSLRLLVVKAGTPTVIAAVADSSITTPGSVGIRGSAGAQLSNFSASAVTLTNPSIAPSFTDPLAPTLDRQLGANWIDVAGDFASNAAGNLAAVVTSPPNIAVLNGVAATNVSESVMVTNLLSGQSAGLVARYQGTGDANYYLGAISRSGNIFTAMIYKNIKGVYTLLVSAPVSASLFNGTGVIQFEAEGPSLRLFVVKAGAPTLVAAAADQSITTPGSVGIRGAAGTQFSNYTVNPVTLTVPSITPSFTDNFAATLDGQLSANWVVQAGDFVHNAAGNMAPISTSAVSLGLLNGVATADVIESVTVTNLLSGQSAALVARYQGPSDANYYDAVISRTGAAYKATIYKNIKGIPTVLISAAVPASLFNGTGTIQLSVIGSSLQMFVFKGATPTLVASTSDHSITAAGSVGIRGSAGTQFSAYNAASA
jgi:hypothetical protein